MSLEQRQALPHATQLMDHLGAEIDKVEDPDGGDTGRFAMPAIGDRDTGRFAMPAIGDRDTGRFAMPAIADRDTRCFGAHFIPMSRCVTC